MTDTVSSDGELVESSDAALVLLWVVSYDSTLVAPMVDCWADPMAACLASLTAAAMAEMSAALMVAPTENELAECSAGESDASSDAALVLLWVVSWDTIHG